MRHVSALLCQLLARLPAGCRLSIECLGNRRGATHFTQQQNLNLEIAAIVPYSQGVPDSNFAGGFGRLTVRFHPSEFTRPGSQSACLEKSGRPEPLIDSYAI